jgi:hypothetical protein
MKRKKCAIEFKVTEEEWNKIREVILDNNIHWAWIQEFTEGEEKK